MAIVQTLSHSKRNCSVTQNFCNCKMYIIPLWITMHNTSSNSSTINDCAPAIANTTIQNILKSALQSLAIVIIWEDMIEQNRDTVAPQEDSNLLQMRMCLFFLRLNNLQSTRLKRWYLHITNPLNIPQIILWSIMQVSIWQVWNDQSIE